MTSATYQSNTPATLPPGLEVETEDVSGAKRQRVAVYNPSGGDALDVSITDGAGIVNTKQVGQAITSTDTGLVAHAMIHGLNTSGSTNYIDVKVTPSGALSVDATIAGMDTGVSVVTTHADDTNHDAFGRDRVAEPANRFDVEFTYDKQPLLMESITAGSATIAHQSATRDVLLTIGATSTSDSADFVGHYYTPYTPGNSQLVELTGTLDGRDAGGSVSFFIRNNGSTTIYTSTQWASSTGVDWGNSQIFWADFQSLKVGRIRMGLVRGGVYSQLLEVTNDNVRANGYWQHPNQPIHYRIYNSTANCITELGYFDTNNGFGWRYTAALSAAQSMTAICATVKSEGGQDLFDVPGYPFAVSNGATTKTVSTTLIPVLSIQLSTVFNSLTNRSIVMPLDLSFVSDQAFYYEVRLNPALSTASWTAYSSSYSCINYDVNATTVTGGITIASGYGGTGGTRQGSVKTGFTGRTPLSINYPGTVGDILSICAIRVGASNAALGAALGWKEIR